MGKYKNKLSVIEAVRWDGFNGDEVKRRLKYIPMKTVIQKVLRHMLYLYVIYNAMNNTMRK